MILSPSITVHATRRNDTICVEQKFWPSLYIKHNQWGLAWKAWCTENAESVRRYLAHVVDTCLISMHLFLVFQMCARVALLVLWCRVGLFGQGLSAPTLWTIFADTLVPCLDRVLARAHQQPSSLLACEVERLLYLLASLLRMHIHLLTLYAIHPLGYLGPQVLSRHPS